jgi:DNA-binding transcriptional LysR family regulator
MPGQRDAQLHGFELRLLYRFGAQVLPVIDPHGLRLALTEGAEGSARPFTPWEGSSVPAEHQVRGLHHGRLWERDEAATVRFITSVLGFERLGSDELLVVCRPDSRLAHLDGAAAADLADEALVMRREGSGTRIVTEEAMRAGGVDPADLRVMAELGTSEAIVRAVEGGLGIGVVSRWVAEKALALGTIAEVGVRGFPVKRPFFLVLPKAPTTRAAEAFVAHLRTSL